MQEPCQPGTALPATAHLTLFGGWPGQTPVNLGPVSERPSRPGRNSSGWAGNETVTNALPAGGFGRQLLETTNSAFTQVWILHTLDRLRAPLPEIYNRDGEQFVSTEAQFPVDKDRRQEIIQRLDAAAPWRRGDGQALLWAWLAESQAWPSRQLVTSSGEIVTVCTINIRT